MIYPKIRPLKSGLMKVIMSGWGRPPLTNGTKFGWGLDTNWKNNIFLVIVLWKDWFWKKKRWWLNLWNLRFHSNRSRGDNKFMNDVWWLVDDDTLLWMLVDNECLVWMLIYDDTLVWVDGNERLVVNRWEKDDWLTRDEWFHKLGGRLGLWWWDNGLDGWHYNCWRC